MSTQTLPRWQKIAQEKNLDISIVELSDLEGPKRIDPEFYQTKFLEVKKRILSKGEILDADILHPSEIKRVYSDSGLQILMAQNVRDNQLEFNSNSFMPLSVLEKIKRNKLKEKDVLMTRSGANYGQTAYYLNEPKEIFSCADILIIRNSQVEGLFLSVFFNTKYGKLFRDRGAYGLAQPHIAPSYLKTVPLPIPSKPFQEKISKMVQMAHAEREKSKKLYTEAEETLLEELGLKNWKPTEKNTAVKDSEEVRLFGRCDAEFFQPKYDEMFEKLKKFKIEPLSKVCKIQRGSLISPDFYNKEKGIPYLRGADFSSGQIQVEKNVFIDKSFIRANEQVVKTGDIIFASIGSVGTSALVEEKFNDSFLSNNTGKLSIKNQAEILPIFLQMVLQSLVGKMQFERMETRTAQPKISNEQVGMLQIPILSKNLQTQIAQKITASHLARENSKKLLESAKKAVEIFVEEDEERAEKFLENTKKEV